MKREAGGGRVWLTVDVAGTQLSPLPSPKTPHPPPPPFPSPPPPPQTRKAVHMLFEGTPERDWREGEKRVSKMVFIGRELDRETFQEVFNNVSRGRHGHKKGSEKRGALVACAWDPRLCNPHAPSAHRRSIINYAPTNPQCLADVDKMPSGRTYEEVDAEKAATAGKA